MINNKFLLIFKNKNFNYHIKKYICIISSIHFINCHFFILKNLYLSINQIYIHLKYFDNIINYNY